MVFLLPEELLTPLKVAPAPLEISTSTVKVAGQTPGKDLPPLEDQGRSLAGEAPMMGIEGVEGDTIATGEMHLLEGEVSIEEVGLPVETVLIVPGLLIGEEIEEDTKLGIGG